MNMATHLYLLTDEDLRAVRELVGRVRSALQSPRSKYHFEDEEGAPEAYVALTPADGILGMEWPSTGTAVSGNMVYGAECGTYDVVDSGLGFGNITPIGTTRIVYNSSTVAIPGDQLILVIRDKGGRWWADWSVGIGEAFVSDPGGGDMCALARMDVTDPLAVDTDQGAFTLRFSGSRWSGDVEYDYGNGSGIFEFWYEAGSLHLTLDGLELVNCGDACFAGGPLTGHGSQGTGTGPTGGTGTSVANRTVCQNTAFTVCVRCGCVDGWYCVDIGFGPEPLYLSSDDVCSESYDIASGPHESYEDALAECPGSSEETGTGTGGGPEPPGPAPTPVTLSRQVGRSITGRASRSSQRRVTRVVLLREPS